MKVFGGYFRWGVFFSQGERIFQFFVLRELSGMIFTGDNFLEEGCINRACWTCTVHEKNHLIYKYGCKMVTTSINWNEFRNKHNNKKLIDHSERSQVNYPRLCTGTLISEGGGVCSHPLWEQIFLWTTWKRRHPEQRFRYSGHHKFIPYSFLFRVWALQDSLQIIATFTWMGYITLW